MADLPPGTVVRGPRVLLELEELDAVGDLGNRLLLVGQQLHIIILLQLPGNVRYEDS